MWHKADQAGSLKKCQLLYNQPRNFIFFPNYKLCLGFFAAEGAVINWYGISLFFTGIFLSFLVVFFHLSKFFCELDMCILVCPKNNSFLTSLHPTNICLNMEKYLSLFTSLKMFATQSNECIIFSGFGQSVLKAVSWWHCWIERAKYGRKKLYIATCSINRLKAWYC